MRAARQPCRRRRAAAKGRVEPGPLVTERLGSPGAPVQLIVLHRLEPPRQRNRDDRTSDTWLIASSRHQARYPLIRLHCIMMTILPTWRDAPKCCRACGASASGNTRSTTGVTAPVSSRPVRNATSPASFGRHRGTVNRRPVSLFVRPPTSAAAATRRKDPPTIVHTPPARNTRRYARGLRARDRFDDAIVGSTQPGEVRPGVVDHVRAPTAVTVSSLSARSTPVTTAP